MLLYHYRTTTLEHPLHYSQYYIAIIYLITANHTGDDITRYSQYYIAMTYLVTANTALLWSILLQPILICYDLSRYNQ